MFSIVKFKFDFSLTLRLQEHTRRLTFAECRLHVSGVSCLHFVETGRSWFSSRCWIAAVPFSKSLNLDSLSARLPGQAVPYCCVCIKARLTGVFGCACQQNKSRSFWINQPTQNPHTLQGSNIYTCFSCSLRGKKRQKQRKRIITGQGAQYAEHIEQSMNIHVPYICHCNKVCAGGFL